MSFPKLNIRQKVALGLGGALLALCIFGGFAAYNLKLMERKVRLVEVCDDFKSGILEARRYEKNYLLYGHKDDLRQGAEYLEKTTSALDQAEALASWKRSRSLLKTLRAEVKDYAELLKVAPTSAEAETAAGKAAITELRALGKRLVDDSHRLAAMERQRIIEIIKQLNVNLVASLTALVALAAVMLLGTRRFVVRPLRIVEETTGRIAKGEFRFVDTPNTGDEVESVMRAFNHMVAELKQRQRHLVHAQKMASIGTLTSGIAHQLNNPLNNIATSCHLLEDELAGKAGELGDRMLANIRQEVLRARDIVKGLLEFSRHKDFHLAPHSLREMVDRSVTLVSSQIPANIDVTVDVPEHLMARMDPQNMQEALINMLINSAQAMEDQGGSIRISAAPGPEGKTVSLTVHDTGSGIPEAQLKRVFDPFFSTKDVGQGTGLGLYVVYGIVQRHEGTIHVHSEEGRGTDIRVDLPAAEGDCDGKIGG